MFAFENKNPGLKEGGTNAARRIFIASIVFVMATVVSLLGACAPQGGAEQQQATANSGNTANQTINQANKTMTTPGQTVSTEGDVTITPITHASLQIEFGGKVIHVDPTTQGDYSKAKQADLILVTDIHQDHLDPAAISKIRKAGAAVVAPSAASQKIENATVLANGESKIIAGISMEAVPMYNLQRGPEPGRFFHDKGRGNGYILTLGSKRVYIAGDTECTPEMRALKNIDIAFLPMNLPYTMPPSEAAECAKAFKPKVVYPYHHRGQNPEEFKTALAGEAIEVRILNWYQ
jgi:L-ascorbate metabolism protein UlaG (beta-lactamase superfamily)